MAKGITEQKFWSIVEVTVDADQEDLACWLMMQCGARGCEVLPADRGRVLVQGTFEQEEIDFRQLKQIEAVFEECGLPDEAKTIRVKALANQDWLARWKEEFKPFCVGDTIVIAPPWATEEIDKLKQEGTHTIILIEPAMAFGTGLHATTQFCLRSIEKRELGRNILDVGTGSGILAIAAALFFKTRGKEEYEIIGVDTDEVAVKSAGENCVLNGVEKDMQLLLGSTTVVHGKTFDSILSNITCEDIVSLLPEYATLLNPSGIVICAGILAEKLPLLENAIPDHPFKIEETELSGEWAGVILRRH